MTANTLIAYVSVRDSEHKVHTFGPGDVLPDWAAELITNPKAWAFPLPEKRDAKPPAKSGPKATAQAWATYAESHGYEIEPGATRKEIIAALEAENIPTD